jgi:hypothetical protein
VNGDELSGEGRRYPVGSTPVRDGLDREPNGLARILFVGDVVGPFGLATVEALLPGLRAEHEVDFCVANGENVFDTGAGIDPASAERLFAAGVDAITTGNHAYDAPGALELLAGGAPVVRPENLAGPQGAQGEDARRGRATAVVERDGIKLGVVNVIGSREGLAAHRACEDAELAVAQLAELSDLVIVDIHASWPAEKLAVAWVLDGRVCAVLGTHTHVPTADARVLPGGTAYISDVGMTGARDSLIGFRPQDIVRQIRRPDSPAPAPADDGEGVLMGVLIATTIEGGAVAIEPVRASVDARVALGR